MRAEVNCVGAGLRPDGAVELQLEHSKGQSRTGDAVRAAWPGALSSVLMEHTHEGPRFTIEVLQGLWLTWCAPARLAEPAPLAPPPQPVPSGRLRAFHVAVSDADGDAEVVLASTPDEAAACFASGWGLSAGTVLAVVEEPVTVDQGPPGPPVVYVVGDSGAVQAHAMSGGRRG